MLCVTITKVCSARISASRPSRMSTARGSRPECGSSSSSTRGPVQDRPRDREALAHALAVGAHHVVAAVAELEALEQLVDARLAVLDAVHVGVEAQVLLRGEVEVEHRVVRDEADGAAHRHGVLAHVVAGHLDAAGARREQRGQHAQRGRLAGAVGAEDAQEAAALEAEGEALQHLAAAERLAQALDLDLERRASAAGPLVRPAAPARGAPSGRRVVRRPPTRRAPPAPGGGPWATARPPRRRTSRIEPSHTKRISGKMTIRRAMVFEVLSNGASATTNRSCSSRRG